MSIVDWLMQTDGAVVGLILRLILAVVIFPHGAQKALGWFGGHGFKGTMKYFTDSGIPSRLRVAGDRRRILGSSRSCGRIAYARRRLRHRMRDACRYHYSTLAARLFHQLVRQPKR